MQTLPLLSEEKNNPNDIQRVPVERGSPSLGFYAQYGKRIGDVISSAVGLVFLFPLFALVALCIKSNSRGPIFFRQCRVGKNGRLFQIIKFRSMNESASTAHAGVTVSQDARVTGVGRILRRYKLDEIPQLWNVLLGDMSLVGPRPELPKFVVMYSDEQRLVLFVRPGITDPASLFYRREEEILSRSTDPEQTYLNQILPDKLARSVAYISTISFLGDTRIIWATITHSFLLGGLLHSRQNPERYHETNSEFTKK